ncbi:effector-associated constant component EACC1 [Peterkaempfera bronchialis]|uniref:Uncharacterized protein n=1 Tax=Peterkaempfera bronchialis TaxID=2126346 RepID=A0A345SWR7_9ACTN|nr:hypothetical protein [Peterkaempfera bronchialis]AXI78172.1 hypothetical protein C7M71_012705 [Peterkaempfera bronchialis]
MDVTLTAEAENSAAELRSLLAWLVDVDELRGRATLVEGPPVSGTLGPTLDAVLVALAPGAATALATALVSWIRNRRSEVTLKATRADGTSVELSAKRTRLLNAEDVKSCIEQAAEALHRAGPAEDEERDGRGGGR